MNLFDNISEWSYQRYARFYGVLIPRDPKWKDKISKIYDLVVNLKNEDLEFIAEDSGCNYEECIMMIRYLMNKRKIDTVFLDTRNKIIKLSTVKEEYLLSIYAPFIYHSHLQIDEIAPKIPGATYDNIEQMKEKVYNDIEYLDSKGLINGIYLNKVDKKIVYYTIEKHKNERDYISINCKNCGAINDVHRGGKARCEYCGSIIEDNTKIPD